MRSVRQCAGKKWEDVVEFLQTEVRSALSAAVAYVRLFSF